MANSKKSENGCPRHGTEYMEKKDRAYYCRYPTPNELTKLCFYHSDTGKTTAREGGEYASTDPNPNYQPNVLREIFKSWSKNKYITRQQSLM